MNRNFRVAQTFRLASILWGMIAAGCLGNPGQPDDIALGQSFELRAGASASLQGGLKVSFDRVGSDSRCPMDAICVWAGDAVIILSISEASSGRDDRELHTAAGGSETSYRAYLVKLVALAPYPRSDQPIRPGDYVATFVVTRRP